MTTSEPSPAPSPNLALKICTWIVMAWCVWFTAVALAQCFARPWAPSAWFTLGLFATGSLIVGWSQYSATFRRSREAASLSRSIFVFLGCIALLTVVNVVWAIVAGRSHLNLIASWLVCLGPLAFCSSLVVLNHRWRKQLSQHGTTPGIAASGQRFSLGELLGAMTLAAIILGIALSSARAQIAQQAELIDPAKPRVNLSPGVTKSR